ncbi:PREDICTED: protein lin-28 homolog B-like [Cariama cristata]|uniref:protein lin-28 homolog B-like n=1 Tax=Cariama cristata TaxID=54380 RepID=UPI000520E7E8|nr:PREDICTED: protein lin-28 homolog B-like [Cariama cristata]
MSPKRGKLPVLPWTGHCDWFDTTKGYGFIYMTYQEGDSLESPVGVFVHHSKLHMKGFKSLQTGEQVEFTFYNFPKGPKELWVTDPGGKPCEGKKKLKGDRCYNCGDADHHAKEYKRLLQRKRCYYCQSLDHIMISCPDRSK